MRHKRAKAYRKLMALYSMSFGFRQPYQVLGDCSTPSLPVLSTDKAIVDSEMCTSTIDLKIELVNQLGTVLQGEIKPSAYRLVNTLDTTESLTTKLPYSDHAMLHSRIISSGKITAIRC